MTSDQQSVKKRAAIAIEMIDTQLRELRELISLYIRPGKNIEPLDVRIAHESFKQWKSRTAALLSQQIRPSIGQEFERRVDRSAGFARGPGLEMMEQTDMAQQFLEVLKGRLRHHPEDVLSG